jgi:hypothetical protein
VVNDAEREGTIATLYTLLRENHLEGAFDAYEALNDWRQVRFTRGDVSSAPARERQGNASVSYPSRARFGDLHHVISSPRAVPHRTPAPSDRLRALTLARQSPVQDASAINGQMVLPLGEGT